ncbi:MAG: hypothetical protein VCF08_04660 [Alphaproteobacteria bacterium]
MPVHELVFASGWKYGKKHGRGVFKFANGNSYGGDWKIGQRHGRGVLKSANGGSYNGEWNDGKRHGRGIVKFAIGEASSYWGQVKVVLKASLVIRDEK